MTQFLHSGVKSGAPGITPHLKAHIPESGLVLRQLDRTEAARGRDCKADGISGTEGKQEMFLVGERLSKPTGSGEARFIFKKCQTNHVKRGRIKRRSTAGNEIPPEAGRFQARRKRLPV